MVPLAITVFCDGLCEPRNPGGTACYGWAAYRDGKKLYEDCAVVCSGPEATNNVAEYSAVIAALEWLIANDYSEEKVAICSDSQLCIYQLDGSYAVRSARVRPLYEKAKRLSARFRNISFRWIPREKNKEADALSRKAYAESLSPKQAPEPSLTERERKAQELAGRVLPTKDANVYRVPSQSLDGVFYVVDLDEGTCECFDFLMRSSEVGPCKHILAARLYKETASRKILAAR
jgi:ribonuclease HI